MITFIRKSLLNTYTAFPLLVCLLAASWSSEAAKPLTAKHRYTGEEMFRGLFFLEGRYANAIPELQSLSLSYSNKVAKATAQARIGKTRNQLIAAIRATNPAYFTELQTALESGNPLKVQSTIQEGRQVVMRATGKLYHLNTDQIEKFQKQATKLSAAGQLNQQAVEHMVKAIKQGQFDIQRNADAGIIIDYYCSLVIVLDCTLLWVVIIMPTLDEVSQTQSSLLTEQLVASICRLSVNPS
ncbi:hypothetical protein [Spirosoma spitsbergense]|uniref:hypothetical protein n=1 Tax=Spirosoma spitsbergense TaxID=431554 RepID=UPI000372FA94|nr:hypothetical protein [Spirosoma spitsbergense]